MKQFKKSLSLFLYFISLFFLISCGNRVDGWNISFELPEGLYGGDIYSALRWYDDDDIYSGFNSIRIGYTYESEKMPINDIKFKVHYGIFEEWFYKDINAGYMYGTFSEDIDDFIIRVSFFHSAGDHQFSLSYGREQNIILEQKININDNNELNNFKVINTIIEDSSIVKLCKTDYLDTCIFDFQLPVERINLALDENNNIYKYHKLSFMIELIQIELIQSGLKEPPLTNRMCNRFASLSFQIVGDEVIITPEKIDFVGLS